MIPEHVMGLFYQIVEIAVGLCLLCILGWFMTMLFKYGMRDD